ncbi:hypothetical protein BTJ39_17345 [Izhakiella australiensis]|uniref:DUF2291 domain-containing protein n=1 Tax=Izhakiella australiensis TaxID=1926881 RepID=A0A1S8YI60_9GAMM|nr:DUF2291 domain-containing protein [Izhakiella australiensis]OON38625.1 hypothetical protein BTJ39_17345 [Izhakiella australiensis]
MNTASALTVQVNARTRKRVAIAAVVTLVVLAAIALDTKVVKVGSAENVAEQGFSPDSYGSRTFPEIKKSVEGRAVEASKLYDALKADQQAATKQYGVGSPMPVFSVSFSATGGECKSGFCTLKVAGLPQEVHVRIQTGPAINGTDLRDATGSIQFGDFKNQIEYQNAGSAINRAMKASVLEPLKGESLTGKELKGTGVFRLLTPTNWLITPVSLEVK